MKDLIYNVVTTYMQIFAWTGLVVMALVITYKVWQGITWIVKGSWLYLRPKLVLRTGWYLSLAIVGLIASLYVIELADYYILYKMLGNEAIFAEAPAGMRGF